jgi:dimethylamine/trimethylamine dehydrogenase
MVFTLEHTRMFRTLDELGVAVIPQYLLTTIHDDFAEGRHVISERSNVQWKVDAMVLCTQRLSDDHLYRALESDPAILEAAGITAVYRIGDCVVPRIAAEAVFDGHRLAREIDGQDAAVARPFIRERRVLGATDDDYERVLGGVVSASSRTRG